jgi:hypothetical protein
MSAVEKAKALLAARTRGTWTWQRDSGTDELFLSFGTYSFGAGLPIQDADFLCEAPDILQALVAEIEALRAASPLSASGKRAVLEEVLGDENPDALFAEGFDDAIVGVVRRCGQPTIVGYDYDSCIKTLMDRDGMSHDEAVEYLEFNAVGAWCGENTPAWVYPVSKE